MTVKHDRREAARSCADDEYEVQDLYHSQPQKPMRIICVGSGISGLCLAFKLSQRMEWFDLTIYEKNKDVGGT